ncbi:ABC transporter permease [Rhodococcus fascians]|uniref:ABC transporter permease n=1 Tax=Rhodococcoides fascians TaxID=1828 RepID=UPI00196183C6|nr:ABC transporter permease [Rhodococcus fascians]MBM7245166.1 ABC transporter permease [Rhodococcus fascians]MBY3811085.1 ABC transporter permease [Rhodococcus fascians]MBY3842588.1 ABC transporter permease [Rhodococcus fascians]MBY3845497.1 ABC transporter permease [Rhodococcus fascians]MBY3851771.1 ABC transporter permease [Rhodococcus fascians]
MPPTAPVTDIHGHDSPPAPPVSRWRDVVAAQRWWFTRVLMLPVHLLFFAIAAFFLVQLIPGDPITIMTGGRLSDADYAATRAQLGFDRSIPSQLGSFLTGLLQLDFGTSITTGRPLSEDFAVRVPQTLELVVLGVIGATVCSLVISYVAVVHRRTWISKVIVGYARSAGALPEFVLGVAAVFVFYATLRWSPAPSGRLDFAFSDPPRVTGFPLIDAALGGDSALFASAVSHLLLPVLVMVVAHSAILTKTLVNSLGDAIDAAPTRFRVASGAPRSTVVFSIYRRAMPAMIAMLGTVFGYMIGGAVILESLFGLGGMGQYAVDAVNSADIIALRGFLVVVAAICLIVFLLADLLTMTVDIRRRPSYSKGA